MEHESWLHKGLPAILAVAAVAIGVSSALIASSRELTPLEATLLNLLLVTFSVLASWTIASHHARDDEEKAAEHERSRYEQLARPAYRRVVELRRSSHLLADTLIVKRALLDSLGDELSSDMVSEWLDSIDWQLKHHEGQLGAAIADWDELLPEEYERLVSLDQKDAELAELREQTAHVNHGRSDPETARRIDQLVRTISELRIRSVAAGTQLGSRSSDHSTSALATARRQAAEIDAQMRQVLTSSFSNVDTSRGPLRLDFTLGTDRSVGVVVRFVRDRKNLTSRAFESTNDAVRALASGQLVAVVIALVVTGEEDLEPHAPRAFARATDGLAEDFQARIHLAVTHPPRFEELVSQLQGVLSGQD